MRLLFILVWCIALVTHAEELKDAKVAICSIVSNEELYIEEWLQYNQLLGFDFVQLYDNAEIPSKYMADLQKTYGDFLRIKHYPGMQMQVPAYEECFYTYKNQNTWAAFIDADEFIVLRKHKSIKEFIHELAPEGGGIVFNWRRMSNNGVKKHLPGPVVSRFTWTTKELSYYIKTMAYLPHTQWVSIHNSNILPGHPKVDVKGRTAPNGIGDWHNHAGNEDVAYLSHYHTKSLQEYIVKRHRGRVDQANRGGYVTYTEIVKEFEVYNIPYKEIQDFAARDFYLNHTSRAKILATTERDTGNSVFTLDDTSVVHSPVVHTTQTHTTTHTPVVKVKTKSVEI